MPSTEFRHGQRESQTAGFRCVRTSREHRQSTVPGGTRQRRPWAMKRRRVPANRLRVGANENACIRVCAYAYANTRIHAYIRRGFVACAHTRIHAYSRARAFLARMRIRCLPLAGRVYLWHTVSTDYRPPDRCARVNAVAALCFGKRAFGLLPAYCLFASTTCVECLQHVPVVPVHSVHRLYPGKRARAQCLQVGAQRPHVCMKTRTRRRGYADSLYVPGFSERVCACA